LSGSPDLKKEEVFSAGAGRRVKKSFSGARRGPEVKR